jgi:hypothetical protein
MMNFIFKIGLLITSFVLCSNVSYSKTYYMGKNGNDSNIGSKAKPFKNLQHVIWNILKPGDTLIISKGRYNQTSYADIGIKSNGKVTTIKAAPGEMVIFDGRINVAEAVDTASWKKIDKYTWMTKSKNKRIDGLWVNNKFYPRVKERVKLKEGFWFFDKKTLKVEIAFEKGIEPFHAKLEFRYEGMITFDTPYWVIENISANYYNQYGVGIWKTHDVIVRNCNAHHNGGSGIYSDNATNLEIDRNHTSFNGAHGGPGWGSGIHILGTTSANNIIKNNISHHNWDSSHHHTDGNGFSIDIGKEKGGAEVYNNIAHSNGGRGLDIMNTANVRLHHNTFYNNSLDPTMIAYGEVSIAGDAAPKGLEVHDNILVARNKNIPLVVWGNINPSLINSDYNIFFNQDNLRTAVSMISQKKSFTLKEWKRISGNELNSSYINPDFFDPVESNFTLKKNSPAIGSGSNNRLPVNYYSGKKRHMHQKIIGAESIK